MFSRRIIWPNTVDDAKKTQTALRKKIKITSLRVTPKYIAGVDAAFLKERIIATACVYTFPDLSLVEHAYVIKKGAFPYIPGFLSFKEGPAIVDALMKLRIPPNLIIFDGQGIAHPLGIGIASHIGVLLDVPTIGCAKSKLVGNFTEPRSKKGSYTPLLYRGKMVGIVFRTKDRVKPVFLSPGHKIDFKSLLEIVKPCAGKYRALEPVRCADLLAHKIKKEYTSPR